MTACVTRNVQGVNEADEFRDTIYLVSVTMAFQSTSHKPVNPVQDMLVILLLYRFQNVCLHYNCNVLPPGLACQGYARPYECLLAAHSLAVPYCDQHCEREYGGSMDLQIGTSADSNLRDLRPSEVCSALSAFQFPVPLLYLPAAMTYRSKMRRSGRSDTSYRRRQESCRRPQVMLFASVSLHDNVGQRGKIIALL
jgi:hypothetical protein